MSVIYFCASPGGGGTTLYKPYRYVPPSGRGFAPFWSENGYTLCPVWSGIGLVEGTTGVSKKEREYANSKWL